MSSEKRFGFDPSLYKGYSEVREIEKSEEKRPWNFLDIVQEHTPFGARILDAGCGDTFKLAELLQMGVGVDRFTAFDLNQKLLRNAQAKNHSPHNNIDLVRADINAPFPFPDNHFDVVTFMLSRHNAAEAFRVLKPGGKVIMERVGEEEKREAKVFFGSDSEGPRGYLSDKKVGALLAEYIQDFKEAGFTIVEYQSGKWKTWVDRSGLIKLLQSTPFVRNFDRVLDDSAVDQVVTKFTTPNGIELTQHRIVIVAIK